MFLYIYTAGVSKNNDDRSWIARARSTISLEGLGHTYRQGLGQPLNFARIDGPYDFDRPDDRDMVCRC